MRGPVLAALFSTGLAMAAAGGERVLQANGDIKWSRQFPGIAARVPDFEKRMASPDAEARYLTVTKAYSAEERNSKLYPPFLRVLLKDPSPKIRFWAACELQNHHIFLKPKELPESLSVHFAGIFKPGDPASVNKLRGTARSAKDGAAAGWAIRALAMAKDRQSLRPAQDLLKSENVFTRFSAAMALLEIGEECDEVQGAAIAELKRITGNREDASHYYRMRASEVLIRLGHRRYFETLISAVSARRGYGDSGYYILKDLTGVYFATAAGWHKWWQTQKKVPVGEGGTAIAGPEAF